jgi:Domain of Unknown Function (DUF1206)
MTSTTARRATRTAGRAARRARSSDWLERSARVGLIARGVFYLLLAGLSARLAFAGGGRQADPNGALGTVVSQPLGEVAVVAAAAGFLCFAAVRLVVAVDAAINRRDDGWWEVVRPGAEALAYAGIAVFTTMFVLGNHSQGSEQSHRSMTAHVLQAPAGRFAIGALGAAILVFYGYQFYEAVTRGFEDGLDRDSMPPALRRIAALTGTAGIVARVVAFGPVGAFLVVAAVTYDAHQAKGLDALVRDAAGHWWGLALLAVVSLGFLSFAAYSFLEAAYRKVDQS